MCSSVFREHEVGSLKWAVGELFTQKPAKALSGRGGCGTSAGTLWLHVLCVDVGVSGYTNGSTPFSAGNMQEALWAGAMSTASGARLPGF